MNIFKHLNSTAFLISFCIGMFIVYIKQVPKRVVYKHPTPYNAGKVIYRDNHDGCFKYEMEEVPCPKDKSAIKKHPVDV